jgi:hypothetical protein
VLLSADHVSAISTFRHEVRLAGCWGGCYEVACFIEHRFGWRRVDGVYSLPDGRPIFLHSWNVTPEGILCDGTADQFGEGEDVLILSVESGEGARYRDKYTDAHNPSVTQWLQGAPYIGVPDRQFWENAEREKKLPSGWWLDDRAGYLSWFENRAEQYPMFAVMRDRYHQRGYEVGDLG